MSLPSESALGTRIVYDLPGIGMLGSTLLSSSSTGLYQPVYVTPGIAGKPWPDCGSDRTSVPSLILACRLAGGAMPRVTQSSSSMPRTLTYGAHWFGFPGC